MSTTARVTVTLPAELVAEIDQFESNRSRFMQESIRREIQRRRREALRRSLDAPHVDTTAVAEEGFGEWVDGLPDEEVNDLVDPRSGTAVRWAAEQGWLESDS